ncbi:ABC transporter substrate-binding protein [Swingsia samuiensis]|uniref:Iron ABC transporter substrate-binding protein n=1 Tax=Swingsia samuiensis TaxID=1293412 RepID=A0A4Y6UIG3_9PROT|nr:ABC transporter substrate-binding protein [Swingsia samuiensis]QDH16610.1 iron ABC transporter substrate-binding protein [Swingsia samuiensis]
MRLLSLLGALILFFGFASEGYAKPPQRIVEGWYAHNAVLIMLGAQDHIVGTVANPSVLPWMFHFIPSLRQVTSLYFGQLNTEELLGLRPDVVFIPQTSRQVQALRNSGLNLVELGFNQMNGLLDCIDNTATILQTTFAARRAQMYRSALLDEVTRVHVGANRPKVLHIESLQPLRVDGKQTIIDEWIHIAGGKNAAQDLVGNKKPVSLEQILNWQPDIIIIGANAGDVTLLAKNGLWSQILAVKNKRVYRNPTGLFPWDRYGPELLLQIEWARQIVQTGAVDEKDITQKVIAFYKKFYGISLTQNDALRMMHALPPQ